MPLRSRPLVAAALLLAFVLILVHRAPAADAATTGVSLPGVQGIPLAPTSDATATNVALDRAKALGAKVVRVEALWWRLEPSAAGVHDADALAAVDRVVDGAATRGMRVLLLVDGTPCWASSAPDADRDDCTGPDANDRDITRYPPADPDSYVEVSTFLAARYGTKLAAFEVWNEPDQVNELYWAGPDKVKRYVALAKAVYHPLKQANPQMKVLAGSFVGANGKWLQALYDAGIKGSYDALSVHFYDLPLWALRTTRRVQLHNGDHAPVWLAEFGFSSCYHRGHKDATKDHVCLTRAGQSHALSDTLNAIANVRWIASAIVYTLTDESAGYQFGLFDAKGHRKPSFATVRRAFTGHRSRITPPRLALTRSHGHLVAHGSGSWIEVYELKAWVGGQLRYRAYVRTDRFGKLHLALPSQLGTAGVRVTLRGTWTRASVTRRS